MNVLDKGLYMVMHDKGTLNLFWDVFEKHITKFLIKSEAGFSRFYSHE